MKKLAFFVAAILLFSNGFAADECRDADGNVLDQAQCAGDANASSAGENGLPEDALDEVNELKVKMRYFKAIGFHKQSNEKREQIAAIYDEYGVPLPDEYKE